MPDKERVVHKKTSRTMKDYIRMAAGPTEEELEQRKAAEQRQLVRMQAMAGRAIADWEKDHDERWSEWEKEFTKAEGSIAKLDRTELARILGDAIQNFDYSTVEGIKKVIARDPELMKDLGLDSATNVSSELQFAEDHRSCRWNDQVFEFSTKQAAVMETLHKNWSNGAPALSKETLLEAAGSDGKDVRDLFRRHEAWRTLIIPGKSRGTWRLAPKTP